MSTLLFLIYILAVFPVYGIGYFVLQKFFTIRKDEEKGVNMVFAFYMGIAWPVMVPLAILVTLVWLSCSYISTLADNCIEELDKWEIRAKKDEDEEDN